MCGGARISDFVPGSRGRRRPSTTSLCSEFKKSYCDQVTSYRFRSLSSEIYGNDEDFEAAFREFKDDSDLDSADDDRDGEEEELGFRSFVFSREKLSLNHDNYSANSSVFKFQTPEDDTTIRPLKHMDSFPAAEDAIKPKPYVPSDGGTICFSSDQGSNSLHCSGFGWGEYEERSPEISSVASNFRKLEEAAIAGGNSQPKKKMKINTKDVVPEEPSHFEPQMEFSPIPSCFEGSWDTIFWELDGSLEFLRESCA
ncbi:ethylene-responsive transcription factor RAP2-12 [Tripterygium wilfordii]|uniref:Ethylene-responsive transcription factor RAP2-12 n=1 Tax=Tripterygium wilfordii TaxID=458696 RepID=A0A7J7DA46_TRIWF|nr:ethylene-responsive transcription factor RAP2-12 [Tripterygium wilfordii]